MNIDLEEHVRVRAYHLWEQAGRPHGQEHSFWFQAVADITSSTLASVAPKRARKPRAPKKAAA